ncbi:E3 ubiquitin-protein ligase MIB2-like [Mytilus edulis]|uniref:E3 ubiquitin-protein ligase MIB2-like n=1 Tax=Mytilus edulis TaxID=6550 RepID=UPI0039EEF749
MRTKTGFRVVRGPDWNNKRQDNGEGFLGTIVYVPKEGSDDKKVTIVWDSGRDLRYRAGLDGKYDLRVFDSAPAGVIHTGINCDSCKENGIRGARWKCCDCGQYNMCSACYMTDKHDIQHLFERIDSPQSSAVNVPPRANSKFSRRTARGLFPNVQVVRGLHCQWKNDDGGESDIGVINEIITWGTDGYRGGVTVVWKSDGSVKNYRVGAEGCNDLMFVNRRDTNTGGNYYCDHLPVVNVVDPEKIALKIGDKVTVNLPLKNFMEMQKDPIYGGWDDGLGQCLRETGTITSFMYDGKSARLQYEDSRTWLVNRMALFRKHTFSLGDPVKIHKDYKVVKELQKGHGGWNDEMKHALGKNGHIVRLDNEDDIMVQIENKNWIFNPTCITPIEGDRLTKQAIAACTDNDNDDSGDTDDSDDDNYTEVSENLADFFYDLLYEVQTSADINVSLVDAASKGDLETIRRLVNRYPNKIDVPFEDQTALQVACYEGKYDTVVFLVQHGASVNIQNKAGDTALHLAAYGNESGIMNHLADNGANVNISNAKQQTALHITVNKSNWKGSNILIDKGADPSLQDAKKDTVMHFVVSQNDCPHDTLKSILGSKKAKISAVNGNGYSILSFAVLMNNKYVVDLIVRLNRKCTSDKMRDGQTALHLAAANNEVEISHCLITTGQADINIKDFKGRTPLMSAAYSGGTLKSVEQLIKFECSVNAQDNSGDTALHILQTQKSSSMMRKRRGADDNQVLCFLLENGADVLIENKNGKTPIDLTKDETEKLLIKTLAKKVIRKTFARTKSGFTFPADWDDMDMMDEKTILRVNIEPSKTELMKQQWNDVQQMFDNTLPQARIVSIQKIQSKFNWEMYQVKKKKLEKQYGFGCANEQNLFHGTLPDKVDLILEHNLDCCLAGTRVGSLGRGTYFAKEAKYSDEYAQSDSKGHKFMFVYSVLAGKTCCGKEKYFKPPPQDTNNPKLLFDSCVDNIAKPRIYCVFEHTQYCSRYLIEYT